MGLLSDFFVATPPQVQRLDLSQSPTEQFSGVQAKRICALELLQLQCCIDGSAVEDDLDAMNRMKVRDAGSEGPWIIEVPAAVCEGLAKAGRKQIRDYASAWAKTDEWIDDGGIPEELVKLLEKIAQLARLAKAEKKRLYLWNSL